MSERLRAMGPSLIVDAVMAQDDKLLRVLLRPEGVSPKFVPTQLHAWAMATATNHGIKLTED